MKWLLGRIFGVINKSFVLLNYINMKPTFILLLSSLFMLSQSVCAQETNQEGIDYDINTVYKPLSISMEVFKDAETIADLNEFYKNSWVKEYVGMEVTTIHNGETLKASGKNHTLTPRQKEIIENADLGSDVSVVVKYYPDNNLSYNEVKEYPFTFMINPQIEAAYPGGEESLKQFLKENVIAQLEKDVFTEWTFGAVKFIVNEEGGLEDIHVFQSTEDEKTDKLLKETICNMSTWIPATYPDGTTVKQEKVLLVGNMQNCNVNLLNVRRKQ